MHDLKEKEEVNNQLYGLEVKAYLICQHSVWMLAPNGAPCPNVKHKLNFRKILKVFSEGNGWGNLHAPEKEKFISTALAYLSYCTVANTDLNAAAI